MIAEIFLPIVFVARVFIFDSYHAPSDSMSPTIKRGDAFFTSKVHSGHYGLMGAEVLNLALGGSYKPGDIIVFQYPPDRNLTFVKRIIASGGDTVEYSDHTLTINGTTITTEAVSEDQLTRQECLESVCYQIKWEQLNDKHQPKRFIVPADTYFVMGDNRDNSNDSRIWGTVPKSYVLGDLIFNAGQRSRFNIP